MPLGPVHATSVLASRSIGGGAYVAPLRRRLLHTSWQSLTARAHDANIIDERPTSGSVTAGPATRVAVIGAGLAGLATAYHLLQHSTPARPVHVDLLDSEGIGGGASGVAAGLLHPFTPKGRLLWMGREAMQEALILLNAAEAAAPGTVLARRNGILRPAQPPSGGDEEEDSSTGGATKAPAAGREAGPAHAAPAEGALLLEPTGVAALIPGLVPGAPGPSLFYPEGLALVVRGYLEALWTATRLSADRHPGASVRLVRERVPSLAALAAAADPLRGRYAAVVVAAGASAGLLPELASLPIRTCGGAVVHLAPGPSSQPLPEATPGILGAPYLVPTPSGAAVGATREWGVPPEDGFSSGALPPDSPRRARAELELLPKAFEKLPQLKDWNVSSVEWGVRAQAPRTRHGRLPLLGRIPDLPRDLLQRSAPPAEAASPAGAAGAAESVGSADPPPPAVWVFVGLGARGIVYHALLGKALAAAVIGDDPGGLPEETRSVWESYLASGVAPGGGGKGGGGGSSGDGGEKKREKDRQRREEADVGVGGGLSARKPEKQQWPITDGAAAAGAAAAAAAGDRGGGIISTS